MSGASSMAALIAALWKKNEPLVRERVGILESAAEACAGGRLEAGLREKAHAAAHKLAGALGMYGHAEAGAISSRLEQMLEGDASVDASELTALARELREKLFRD